MSNVTQPWVGEIPWKQQSILFSSLRGPDQDFLANIKEVSRWMRMVSQNNADPSKPYMQIPEKGLPKAQALDKELEHCTVHFVHHFADGLAVIAYHHPDPEVACYAATLHFHIAEELFHFIPETRESFLLRHRDKTKGIVDTNAETWNKVWMDSHDAWMASAVGRFASKVGL